MISVIVFMLIASGGGNGSDPRVLAHFPTQKACVDVALKIEKQYASRNGAPFVYTMCVQANILLPNGGAALPKENGQ